MSPINGWHFGERIVHKKLGHESNPTVSRLYQSIEGDLPPEHALFHTTRLPFVPVVTLDESGRPWGSILAGEDGKPGFIRNSRYSVLSLRTKVWPGEPLLRTVKDPEIDGDMLVAGIGIEFPTRRRNKFAGKVTKVEKQGDNVFELNFMVNEALGNCPKYINARDLVPYLNTSPKISMEKLSLSPTDRLPEEIISFIQNSDTVFLGTTYHAPSSESRLFPSHVGMNQRGGRKGFVRVVPSDGRTVVLPDYSGNRFMTSLGNIEATPLASLTFVSFDTGSILYITGTAQNLYGASSHALMPFQNTLTTVVATGYTFVVDALPVRQSPQSKTEQSPYSPPVRYLAEEAPQATVFSPDSELTALLTRITPHSPSIATFSWELSTPVPIVPGQAAIMDFTPLLGARRYQHMAYANPQSVNDDRIRTWTVSAAQPTNNTTETNTKPTSMSMSTRTFDLTMREKPGGLVTGALFSIMRKLEEVGGRGALEHARNLELKVGMIGVTGEFFLQDANGVVASQTVGDGVGTPQAAIAPTQRVRKLLWVAGGIGVTPFLAMLRGLQAADENIRWDIQLVLATREPEALLPLISSAFPRRQGGAIRLKIDVFSEKEIPELGVSKDTVTQTNGSNGDVSPQCDVTLHRHKGRVTPQFFEQMQLASGDGTLERLVYVCGPESFEKVIVDALVEKGVERGSIKREGFAY